MTNEMEYLMHLYSCGATGRVAEPPRGEICWEQLVRLAVSQSITYTVTMAIKKSDTGCPEEIRSRLMSSLLGASLANQIKTAGILELLGEFERLGIHTVLLKGIAVAELYANPECRVSADTDILISPADEEASIKLLESMGFTVNRRTKDEHHSVCIHSTLGMIELHIRLWEDMLDDVLFEKSGIAEASVESHRKIQTQAGVYYVLGSTDSLMFLAFHMIKHFITGGMSLRMMMDTALYFRHEKENIDIGRFWGNLRTLHLDNFMNVVFGAMIEYCGFDAKDFPGMGEYSPEDVTSVLNDLEIGGWQGKNDEKNRKDGWFYLKRERQISEMGALKFFLMIRIDVLRDKLYALFPPVRHMIGHYPKLKKQRWLYPLCWLHRLFARGISASVRGDTRSRKNISDSDELTQAGKARLELFRELKIV